MGHASNTRGRARILLAPAGDMVRVRVATAHTLAQAIAAAQQQNGRWSARAWLTLADYRDSGVSLQVRRRVPRCHAGQSCCVAIRCHAGDTRLWPQVHLHDSVLGLARQLATRIGVPLHRLRLWAVRMLHRGDVQLAHVLDSHDCAVCGSADHPDVSTLLRCEQQEASSDTAAAGHEVLMCVLPHGAIALLA